jgi:hypothetical protein
MMVMVTVAMMMAIVLLVRMMRGHVLFRQSPPVVEESTP